MCRSRTQWWSTTHAGSSTKRTGRGVSLLLLFLLLVQVFLFGKDGFVIPPHALVDFLALTIGFRSDTMTLRALPVSSIGSAIRPSKDTVMRDCVCCVSACDLAQSSGGKRSFDVSYPNPSYWPSFQCPLYISPDLTNVYWPKPSLFPFTKSPL